MLRIILGIVAGLVIWSLVWVGMDALFAALSPDWFGKNLAAFQNAVSRNEGYAPPVAVTFCLILLGTFCSLVSGFAATLIARERIKTTFILGGLLLTFGIFVEARHWKFLPLWYHSIFLILLIPMTILGGELKAVSPARPVLRS